MCFEASCRRHLSFNRDMVQLESPCTPAHVESGKANLEEKKENILFIQGFLWMLPIERETQSDFLFGCFTGGWGKGKAQKPKRQQRL